MEQTVRRRAQRKKKMNKMKGSISSNVKLPTKITKYLGKRAARSTFYNKREVWCRY